MLMRALGTTLFLIILTASAGAHAQSSWLPTNVAESAAQQLGARLKTLPIEGAATSTYEQRVENARAIVGTLRDVIEGWGGDGILGRTPELSHLTMPESKNQWLDAMADYQLCNLVLFFQLAPEGEAEDVNLQLTGVIGLTAITMTILYLRESFVNSGGSLEQIKAFLTSEHMERIGAQVQQNTALFEKTSEDCSPVVIELVMAAKG